MPCWINIYKEHSNDENIMFTSEIIKLNEQHLLTTFIFYFNIFYGFSYKTTDAYWNLIRYGNYFWEFKKKNTMQNMKDNTKQHKNHLM